MEIQLLTIKLHLEGCQSLKAKRHRLAGVKQRLGRDALLAILESDFQNVHQSAEWSIVIVASNPAQLAQKVAMVEQSVNEDLDARIVSISRERLY